MYMKLSTKLFGALLAAGLTAGAAQAQNVILSEDFANGIPADWGNEDTSGNGAIWTWCNDPAAGQGDGCPAVWGDAINQQMPFASATATNGFVTVDSDAAGNITHTSELTIASQDFSAAAAVWIEFQTHIGVFTFGADDNAILRVSADGGTNWTNYTIFPGLTTSERWSENPEEVVINISDAAAGQSDVLIQWQWTGSFEYNWNLDDIVVYDGDPRPANDMRVNSFFAVAPNAVTPASQVTPFGFIADIQNRGAMTQQNVTLDVSISDANGEVFSDQVTYASVAPDSVAENVFFATEFSPAMEPNAYIGNYTLTLSEDDAVPADNVQEFQFVVSDTLFSRDNGESLGGTRPADDNDFTYGNIYYVPNGDGLFARYVTFGISNPEDLPGQNVSVLLYEWGGDADLDGQANAGEYEGPIAFNFYTITGEEEGLVTVPIDIDNNFPELKDDTYYIVAVQFAPEDDDTELFLNTTTSIDYNATQFYQDSVENKAVPYVALDVSNVGDFSLNGFGFDNVPVVRLSIGDSEVSTRENLLPEGAVKVHPTPANEQFWATFDLEAPASQAVVSLMNVKGQIVETRDLGTLQQETVRFDVSALPAGQYFLRLQTSEGVSTKPVVVQH